MCVDRESESKRAMKRILFGSSRMVATTTSKHSTQKPWHILQCHAWHASETSSQSESHRMSWAKSLWPLPFQQKHDAIEAEMHVDRRRQWPNSTSFTRPQINGFGVPSLLQGNHYGLASDMKEVGKTRRVLELAHLYALKDRLQKETYEVMAYDDLLEMCVRMGVASSSKGATQLVKCLDDASLILILQDIVFLNPGKVAQLISKVIPTAPSLLKEREGIHQELHSLTQEKENIDKLSNRYSRAVLWLGLGYLTLQMLLIFRLTFWDLSWDVMEPIAYFVTNITLLLGYGFFMITSKHPSYRNFDATLRSSKQRKLMKRRNFDMAKLLELQSQCSIGHTSLGSISH